MRRMFAAFVIAVSANMSASAGHDLTVGDLQIIHPHIPQPAANAHSAAGYVVISNDGDVADRLIAIETGFAHAMLHVSAVADGIATMRPLDGVEVPAHDAVVLEPGGMHIMLMGLNQTLTEGDMLPATLVFEHAGRIAIEFMVDPTAGSVDHSHMSP